MHLGSDQIPIHKSLDVESSKDEKTARGSHTRNLNGEEYEIDIQVGHPLPNFEQQSSWALLCMCFGLIAVCPTVANFSKSLPAM